MTWFRSLIPALACVLAVLPASASASTNYHESIAGIETGIPYSTASCPAPNSVSPFAGVASGTLDGTFQVAVCHTPLSPNAEILGGSFVLISTTMTVSGQFAPGGTVSLVDQSVTDGTCTQTYAVSGELQPAGKFSATLTHYGVWTGSCNVFFATITGRAALRL